MAVEAEDAIVADRDAVRVTREVIQENGRAGRRHLRVDDPVVTVELGQKIAIEWRGQEQADSLDVLPPKDLRERAHREKEAARTLDPPSSGRVEPSGGDDAMQMDVEIESLRPSVQDCRNPGSSAEMTRVPRKL